MSRISRAALSRRLLLSVPIAPHFRTIGGSRSASSWYESGPISAVSRAIASQINTHGSTIALGAGGVVIIYGMSSLAYHATSTFLSLTLTDAMYLGYATGFTSAAMLAGGAARAYLLMTLQPDSVFAAALVKISADERVGAALGASIAPGELRAYTHVPGHLSTTKMGWVDPRVSMLFQVVGKDTGRQAMVRV